MNSPIRSFSSARRFFLRAAAGMICFAFLASLARTAEPVKRYLYMSFPDGAQEALAEHAPGIAVFDIDNGHKLARFIPVPQFSQGGGKGVNARPLGLRGFCVSLA